MEDIHASHFLIQLGSHIELAKDGNIDVQGRLKLQTFIHLWEKALVICWSASYKVEPSHPYGDMLLALRSKTNSHTYIGASLYLSKSPNWLLPLTLQCNYATSRTSINCEFLESAMFSWVLFAVCMDKSPMCDLFPSRCNKNLQFRASCQDMWRP